MTVDPDVERVDQGDDVDPLGAELVCESCGKPFVHTKSGRKPKRCEDCRSTPRPRGDAAPKRPRSIDALEKNLAQQLALIGMTLMFVDPFDAQVVIKNGEEGARVLANLAMTNDAARRFLEASAELAGWGPVLLWTCKLSLPILAHHGLLPGVADPATRPRPDGNGKASAGAPYPGAFGPFDGVAL